MSEVAIENLSALLDYYNKPKNKLVVASWMEFFQEERLNDADISKAAKLCYREYSYMPTQNQFLALLGRSVEDQAIAQLAFYRSGLYWQVDSVAREAMVSLGGVWAYKRSGRPERFQAAFVSEYKRLSENARREGDGLSQMAEQKKQQAIAANIQLRINSGVSVDEDEQKFLENFLGGVNASSL